MQHRTPIELGDEFDQLSLGFTYYKKGVTLVVEPTLEQSIRNGQLKDDKILEINGIVKEEKATRFYEDESKTWWYEDMICVPNIREI